MLPVIYSEASDILPALISFCPFKSATVIFTVKDCVHASSGRRERKSRNFAWMDGFSRRNASGRMGYEANMQFVAAGEQEKYIFFSFTRPQMFIRKHCRERRGEEPAKTLKAPQHASRISIHFNSFLSSPSLVRKKPQKPFHEVNAQLFSTISKCSGNWGACYMVPFYAINLWTKRRMQTGVLQQLRPDFNRFFFSFFTLSVLM